MAQYDFTIVSAMQSVAEQKLRSSYRMILESKNSTVVDGLIDLTLVENVVSMPVGSAVSVALTVNPGKSKVLSS